MATSRSASASTLAWCVVVSGTHAAALCSLSGSKRNRHVLEFDGLEEEVQQSPAKQARAEGDADVYAAWGALPGRAVAGSGAQ